MKTKKTEQIVVRIDLELRRGLEQAAETLHTDKSDLVREAVHDWLACRMHLTHSTPAMAHGS